MSLDPHDSNIKQFYESASMPQAQVDAVLSQGKTIAVARKWKRVAIASSTGFVVMLLTCSVLLWQIRDLNRTVARFGDSNVRSESLDAQPSQTNDSPEGNQLQKVDPAPIRLVAVKNHGNRCPHCRATGEIFAELQQ